MVRRPAVAGLFYPSDPAELDRTVTGLLAEAGDAPAEHAVAIVAPHAGYVYSGAIAASVYARVRVPSSAIVIAPNHTGLGARAAVITSGRFAMPGGDVEIDERLAGTVRDVCGLTDDADAHRREHALEVHLPFLRARNPDVRIVPIVLGGLSFEAIVRIGHGLASAIHACGRDVLLVASTDMSHYIAAEEARGLDRLALDRLEALDARGLYDVVRAKDITMCGFIPTCVVLIAASELGAKHARLVRYGNSGDVSGDYQRVVGYASAVVA
ncbi:MAG: AmmeMemoRadiSam system protein B [Deltaproteobacteria bacterium]|nr:AmmeMemoRadiSam system protein B [Deltaproteobacteria bacterium]